MYFYDLAPYNGDIRGSDYHGLLRLVEFDASLTDSSGKDEELTADITVYYSTTAQDVLKPKIDKFGDKNAAEVDKMLDEGNLFKELGTINKKTGGIDTGPVSYTHLDVYKRQMLYRTVLICTMEEYHILGLCKSLKT